MELTPNSLRVLKTRYLLKDLGGKFIERGCKGITVFRYGSKRGTLLRFDDVT